MTGAATQPAQMPAEPTGSSASRPLRDTKVRALILAAGRGARLGNAGAEVPKCLLEIGRRRLIEHQLNALADAGVGPTAVVVGYAADEVRESVGIRAEYFVNTRWNSTNSLYSFRLAREWLTGPTVVMNCDVLFSPEILERLLEADGDAVAVDTRSGRAREQMAVEIVDGRVADMRKDLPHERVHGENVGILKLTAETVGEVLEEADRLLAAGEERTWLGAAVANVAQRRRLLAVDVSDLPWVEIDFPTDLVRARKEVWPEIQRAAKRPRRIARGGPLVAGILLLVLMPFLARLLLPTATAEQWETIGIAGDRNEHVLLGEPGQSWWLLDAEGSIRFVASGPGPLRIDSRLLDPPPEGGHYVLGVRVGDEPVGWFLEKARLSGTYTHERWKIGKRGRATLELDAGRHPVEVWLVAPETAGVLVRARYRAESGAD